MVDHRNEDIGSNSGAYVPPAIPASVLLSKKRKEDEIGKLALTIHEAPTKRPREGQPSPVCFSGRSTPTHQPAKASTPD
jgi:hypothetical protein